MWHSSLSELSKVSCWDGCWRNGMKKKTLNNTGKLMNGLFLGDTDYLPYPNAFNGSFRTRSWHKISSILFCTVPGVKSEALFASLLSSKRSTEEKKKYQPDNVFRRERDKESVFSNTFTENHWKKNEKKIQQIFVLDTHLPVCGCGCHATLFFLSLSYTNAHLKSRTMFTWVETEPIYIQKHIPPLFEGTSFLFPVPVSGQHINVN